MIADEVEQNEDVLISVDVTKTKYNADHESEFKGAIQIDTAAKINSGFGEIALCYREYKRPNGATNT